MVVSFLMNKEWLKYYRTLNIIRESGLCNMYGAHHHLREIYPELNEKESIDILQSWMKHFEEIQIELEK